MTILLGAQSGWAQQTEQATEEQQGQVVNQADKKGRVTLLQRLVLGAGVEKVAVDTPSSVTVLDQADIDNLQATTIGEVLRAVPGVNTAGSERPFGQGFNIRGIGAPESAGEEGRIIVNVDGAIKFYEQYRMGGFFSDPELYKRVEVLRGPAFSTLYGSGALGGVINFTTKDASDFIAEGENGALRLKTGYNSNKDGWLGSFVFAQRLTEDFDFLLSGNYREAQDYETGNGTIIPSSDFASWSGLAKLTGQVGDEGTLRLSYQQWDSDADDQDYAQIGGPVSGGSVTGFGTVDRHVVDQTAVVSYENPFSDNDMLDLKISASLSNTTVEQRDASGIPSMGFVCGMPGAETFCDVDYGYRTVQGKVENTSEWSGNAWENFLTYGVQLAHQTRTAEAFDPDGDPFANNTHPEGTDFKSGFYAQDEFIWDERLTIIPGMRVEWRELTPDASTTLIEAKDDWAYSPKIAALYKLNETFSVFGSIAHTERFPTLDEIFSRPLPSYNLELEKSNNYEAGFSVSTFDLVQAGDALQLKTTGFYNDIDNLIYRQCSSVSSCTTGGFASQYVNLNEAEIYGAELEAAYDSDYFFANASYTHVTGKNKLTGAYLTSVAPYEFDLTVGGKLPDHALRFGWRARFVAAPQDAIRDSAGPLPPPNASSTRYSESFNIHDVFLTWKPQDGRLAGWEAEVGVDNIFDTQYKEFLMNEPSKGRTYKVSLAKQFGW